MTTWKGKNFDFCVYKHFYMPYNLLNSKFRASETFKMAILEI